MKTTRHKPETTHATARVSYTTSCHSRLTFAARLRLTLTNSVLWGCAAVVCLTLWTSPLRAGTVCIPNGSFESPVTTFVDTHVDSWQKSPKPFWYDEGGGFYWEQLTGLFLNSPPTNSTHIDNCDGNQAIFLFAVPEVALFQDYNSADWTNSVPTHAFDAKFAVGNSYTLTVGVIGGGGNMTNGATMEISLYSRDGASNRVTVATTSITNSPTVFTNTTHLIDFQVRVPSVKSTDPWADQNIGIQLLSTVRPEQAGGYWDLDNVRLTETIDIPNGSFESPATTFVDTRIDAWQKMPKPFWYDESGGFMWDQLTGLFLNTPPGSADRIENCDGNQAVWLFAVPEVGLFQDYDSTDWTNSVPTHAFNTRFEVGRSYTITVGVLGGGGNMLEGVSMEASLYYRDGASNRVTVAATNVVYSQALFTNAENKKLFVDFQVRVPAVKSGNPWANQHIGVQFLSTVRPDQAGGYWDLDHVRLSEVREPALEGLAKTNGQFTLTLQSEPGLRFEILATTNLAPATANWTSLGNLTNVTGTARFVDTATDLPGRFYQARQLP